MSDPNRQATESLARACRKAIEELRECEQMKIMQSDKIESVCMSLLIPHKRQADITHGQTLERLNERGGLGLEEAYSILNDISVFDLDKNTPIETMIDVFKCPHCADNRAKAARLEVLLKELHQPIRNTRSDELYTALDLIHGICIGYDGFHTIESLKGLIDEVKEYAILACMGKFKNTSIYRDAFENGDTLVFIDFTTWEGHGKLIDYLKRLGLWEPWISWHENHIEWIFALNMEDSWFCTEHLDALVNTEILTTPELFLSAVISFLEER